MCTIVANNTGDENVAKELTNNAHNYLKKVWVRKDKYSDIG